MPRTLVLALSGMAVALAAGLLGMADPAHAELSRDTAGCIASATVVDDDGTPVTVEASATSVTIPRSDAVQWRASTNRVTHDHHGSIDLELGPFSVNVGRWGPTSNRQNDSTAEGVAETPTLVRQFPSAKWTVTGYHRGIEGQCQGSLVVEVEGSAAGTAAAGIASLAATVVAGAGAVQAAREPLPRGVAARGVAARGRSGHGPGVRARRSWPRGRPGLGAASGALLGLFVAVDLFLAKVIASGSGLFVTLPVALATLGAVLGVAGPLARPRGGAGEDGTRY